MDCLKREFNVLVVDDDEGMTETLSDIFCEIGYDVDVANDGYKALDMAAKKSYSIVLMDIKMPDIDGVEVFRRLKPIIPDAKVLMMTAFAVDNLMKEAIDEGACRVFDKPLNMDEVITFLERSRRASFVLIVDDDPGVCETIKDSLEFKGYTAAIAHSGSGAIEFAKHNHVNAAIIDVKMPVLNGLETYVELRNEIPGLGAVMITGFRQETEAIVKEALDKKAHSCFYKPLNMDDIFKALDDLTKVKDSN